MQGFEPATNTEGMILEPDNYVVTVKDFQDTEGQFGPQILWKFTVALASSPDVPIYNDEGSPYEFWDYTSTKTTPNAEARKWIRVLLGRDLEEGETPDLDSLIGKRMRTLIVKVDKQAGGFRNKINRQGTPVLVASRTANGAAKLAPKAPATNSAAPSETSREELLSAYERGVKRAVALDVPGADVAAAVQPKDLEDDELVAAIATLSRGIKEAAALA